MHDDSLALHFAARVLVDDEGTLALQVALWAVLHAPHAMLELHTVVTVCPSQLREVLGARSDQQEC